MCAQGRGCHHGSEAGLTVPLCDLGQAISILIPRGPHLGNEGDRTSQLPMWVTWANVLRIGIDSLHVLHKCLLMLKYGHALKLALSGKHVRPCLLVMFVENSLIGKNFSSKAGYSAILGRKQSATGLLVLM